MKNRNIRISSVLLILWLISATTKLSAEQDVQTLADKLQSKDWHTRVEAFYEISDTSGWGSSLGSPSAEYYQIKPIYKSDIRIRKALLKLIAIESNPQDLKLDMEQREGHADYRYAVFATIANMRELEGVPYLLSYTTSDILDKVADVGPMVLPQVLDKLYKGKEKIDKYAATVVLVSLLKKEPPFSKYPVKSKLDIKKALIYITKETDDLGATSVAVGGLKEFAIQGDTETLKVVEKMAEDDRAYMPKTKWGKKRYPVREAALKVLSELKAKGIYKTNELPAGTTQAIKNE